MKKQLMNGHEKYISVLNCRAGKLNKQYAFMDYTIITIKSTRRKSNNK